MWTSRTTAPARHRVTDTPPRSRGIQPPATALAIRTFLTTSCRRVGVLYRLVSSHEPQSANDMMHRLNQSTTHEFLGRFYSFDDGVLRKLEIFYTNDGERSVSAWVATRDTQETQNDGWVCVRLVITRAQDFCFTESAKTTAQILSQGIHICWFGETVGLEFGYFIDPPESLAELKTSKFFVAGFSLDWALESY